MKKFLGGACLLAILSWTGCTPPQPVVRQPAAVPAPPVSDLGVWENLGSGEAHRKMIFEPGGRLIFEGGLTFFNPARWQQDKSRQELILTFPAVDVDKLQIFQMYVGQGVKAFDPVRKQVTYSFNTETSTLNIGGWEYSRSYSKPITEPVAEPVIK